MSDAQNRLLGVKSFLWVWSGLCVAFLLLWYWWALTASTYRYQVAPITGVLTNERWNADFVLTATLLFHLLVPLTLIFSIDAPLRSWRRTLHSVVTVVFFVYGIAAMAYWATFYRSANDPDPSNAHNPANDRRWCNLYYASAGSACLQTAPTPGLVASMLTVDGPFLWKFWFLIVWLAFLMVDFAVILAVYRPVVNEMLEAQGGVYEEPLLPAATEGEGTTTTTVEVVQSQYRPMVRFPLKNLPRLK